MAALLRGTVLSAVLLVLLAGAAALLARPAALPVVPVQLEELAASVSQGEYLARAGNCAACHTAQGGKPYAGGLAFHTPFGLLYSTNITSDEATGIGSWSFADFYNSMKHGVRPDGTHLYPAFPYTDFARMTDDDLASLYVYLQTLAPVDAPAPANALDFPFNRRELLAGWKLLFHDPATHSPDPGQSEAWNRGAYLVEGPGHCGACHTPRNLLGAEKPSLALTGGVYRDKTRFGWYRDWSGVNLTAHEAGLAAWSEQNIVDYLQTGVSGNAVVHGPMREVVMHSTRFLTEADLRAMAVYLKALPANAQAAGPAPDEEVLAAGEVIYTVHCGSCHLPTGKGDQGLGVPLVGSPIVNAPNPASLVNVILYGPHLPSNLVVDRSQMKMFGKRLSDEDIANVASYVRTEFGVNAGAVSEEQVNAQR